MATVLLIEDEEIVRSSLRLILEEEGFDVFEAADGVEGVDQFRQMTSESVPADVVVTDILMPNKHGYKTIADIQEIDSDTKIIAISGGGGTNPKLFLEIAEFLGVEHVLAKPFTSKELLDAVNDCLA